jgi:hypothetical protein
MPKVMCLQIKIYLTPKVTLSPQTEIKHVKKLHTHTYTHTPQSDVS